MVTVGSASIDERGKAKGGRTGNQSGRELRRQAYYLHSSGWRGFRCADPDRARLIADAMDAAIDNPHIGYDQGERGTLYKAAQRVDWMITRIVEDCETDCSALVRVCCRCAGIDLPNFNTRTEPKALLNSGWFLELPGSCLDRTGERLLRGDILVTPVQGHTVVVLSDGQFAGEVVTDTDVATDGLVHVSDGTWWVRRGPGHQEGRVCCVDRRSRMQVYGERAGWVAVKIMEGPGAGRKGWISKRSGLVK